MAVFKKSGAFHLFVFLLISPAKEIYILSIQMPLKENDFIAIMLFGHQMKRIIKSYKHFNKLKIAPKKYIHPVCGL